MAGGRPREGKSERLPELAELAEWFRQALVSQNFSSAREFAQHIGLGSSTLYRLYNGEQLIKLDILRALAAGLNQDVGQAERVWRRANEALDRRITAQRLAKAPYLESWTQLPRPREVEPALRNLLDSLSEVTDVLPYRKLALEQPPLSAIYVRQHVHHAPSPPEQTETRDRRQTEKDRPAPPSKDQVIPAVDALDQQEHLIVIGDPGSGKSTFSRHLARRLARTWLGHDSATEAPLREPVLPVLVAARDLVEERPWPEVLAMAAGRTLGRRAISRPLPALFEGRVQGARWLVFVDGLDEIINQDARAKVMADLVAHARPGSPYRFVITSRGLTDQERGLLRSDHIGVYTVQPFGRSELRDFAQRWFDAQRTPGLVERYLHEISDGRLRTLAGNPLLATIAAITLATRPDQSLPTSRTDLYSRFYDLLTDEDASGRSTEKELVESWASQPGKQRFATWVYERWPGLVERLARHQVEQSGGLLAEAARWADEHHSDDRPLPLDWQVILREVLLTTGLFVQDDADLRFLHHSLAEFLAARTHAQDIPAGFPDLDEWIERGLSSDQRTFALFTFALWAKRGNDLDLVLNRLGTGTTQQLLLAGRVLAETSAKTGTTVIDRLVDMAVAKLETSGMTVDSDHSEAFVVLGELIGNEVAAERLQRILDRVGLRPITRVEAAIAFGRITSPRRALPYLTSLTEEGSVVEVLRAALGLSELFPDEPQHMAGLLLPLCDDLPRSPHERAALANGLRIIGEDDRAVDVARSVVADPRPSAAVMVEACETWLIVAGRSALPELIDVVVNRPDFSQLNPNPLVSALVKLGCRDEAIALARRATTDEQRAARDLDDAVEALLTAAGASAVDEIMAILARRELDAWARSLLSVVFANAGHRDIALDFAKQVLADPLADSDDQSTAVEAMVATGDADAIRNAILVLEARMNSSPWDLAKVAQKLADMGQSERAVELARGVLAAPAADAADLTLAVQAWFKACGGQALDEVLATLAERAPLSSVERASLLMTLAANGGSRQAVTWAWENLRAESAEDTAEAIRCLLSFVGSSAVDEIVDLVRKNRSVESFSGVADLLMDFGELAHGASLKLDVLIAPTIRIQGRLAAAESLVALGRGAESVEALRQALVKADRRTERMRLQQLLTWVMLSDPDVELCEHFGGKSPMAITAG